ncbi:hypothetical protein QBC35DRAFT_16273 [Podospora australis]|uniref:Rhodopsin domain-containing protein n=1 Tax=Podospora australis TaxID=1536484 RepID=A0AAN7AEC1_9PEZI|nr:hypothetical protein QBC35DRAFT_16273 [Podospora australis]
MKPVLTSSRAWGEVPTHVNLSENQDAQIYGAVSGVMVMGLAAVALRIYTRLMKNGPGFAADDYVILFAAVMGIGTAVCCLISVPWGGGKHLWTVDHDQFTKLYQTTYAFVIVYITCVSATKISILLFYRRVFGTTVIWYLVFAVTCAHWAEVTITWLTGCRPVKYYWEQYTNPVAVGTCIDAPLFYFINGVIGLVVDLAVLFVPIPTIWQLNMPTTKKVLVGGVLFLGGFVCVASAIRIVMMNHLVKSQDFTWAMSNVFVWSCIEPFIGIVCACLPTYAPLLRRWWRAPDHSDHPKLYFLSDPTSKMSTTLRGDISSKSKRIPSGMRLGDWASRNCGLETILRGDDEIELTVDISAAGQTGSSRQVDSRDRDSDTTKVEQEEPEPPFAGNMNEIMVRKDFSWSTSKKV